MEVPPSEDNGNVPAEVPEVTPEPTPSEPPAVVPTEDKTEPVAELFELPDGRKVDAATLSKEWKENFYPEYTKKSQDLAKIQTTINPPPETPKFEPQTWDEVTDRATQNALKIIEDRDAKRIADQKAIEDSVGKQLEEIKAIDKTLDENTLFLHATKYGFRDLKQAHQNMVDMRAVIKKTQETTVQNINKRNDPVSMKPGANGNQPNPSQFLTSREYLRALKGSQ